MSTVITPAAGFSSRVLVRLSANQSIGTTATKVQFNTEDYDDNNEYDNATNYRFTAKATGYYHISVNGLWLAPANNVLYYLYIYKNGAELTDWRFYPQATFNVSAIPGSIDLKLNAGDYIEIYAQTSAGIKNLAGGYYTSLSIHRFG